MLWKDFVVYMIFYYVITLIYHFGLNIQGKRYIFYPMIILRQLGDRQKLIIKCLVVVRKWNWWLNFY